MSDIPDEIGRAIDGYAATCLGRWQLPGDNAARAHLDALILAHVVKPSAPKLDDKPTHHTDMGWIKWGPLPK